MSRVMLRKAKARRKRGTMIKLSRELSIRCLAALLWLTGQVSAEKVIVAVDGANEVDLPERLRLSVTPAAKGRPD